MDKKIKMAIGLMSGTSLDGIDAAILSTDGEVIESFGEALTAPYDDEFRDRLKSQLGKAVCDDASLVQDLTLYHVKAVSALLEKAGLGADDIDLIGFHGQTIFHDPAHRKTVQIGDGALLAKETGIPVVCDFRTNDVEAGGEGAPLAPLYHRALAHDLEKPVAVLNIGGVANVTWINGPGTGRSDILAFDTGPGNALIDDWVREKTGKPYDHNGDLACAGEVDTMTLLTLLQDGYFRKRPPKSLDRDDFKLDSRSPVRRLSLEDGAATLTAFTISSIMRGLEHLSEKPKRWLVCGGGRHNQTMMDVLRAELDVPVDPVEAVGWHGDALEAQAFAFLAVRSTLGLPISLPSTTNAPEPMTGGALFNNP